MGYSYLINYNPWIIGFELLSFFFWHRNCIKKNNIQFINKLPALHFSNKSSTFYFKINNIQMRYVHPSHHIYFVLLNKFNYLFCGQFVSMLEIHFN